MPVFKSKIDLHSDDYQKNAERMFGLVGDLKEKLRRFPLEVVKKQGKNTLKEVSFCREKG